MLQSAVFLDRDDTINKDPGYLSDVNKVELLPGVGEGISFLKNKLNLKIIVISNQSGITRGFLTESDVDAVNSKIQELLKTFDVEIDDFFFCPYHPDFDPPEKVECRKPSPKMIFEAAEKHSINLKRSFTIGDKETDILCGKNAGTETILVLNGKNAEEIINLKNGEFYPNFVADNFLHACEYISSKIGDFN
ncbi:MAG: HAD family hydrolase [Melioribacteraceae bacterium]|nr:HAD family hydrolase [Melioribacteraceae bacterium]MCO6472448.1 HAD family hydrolase [Melioribacteraceae bacterium]